MKNIRVRFAPSPTGDLHIGGARTALFNWLFARNMGGSFILRIEDTDLQRSNELSSQGILEGLKWLGITWDEGPGVGGTYGPYYQSQRLDIYAHYIEQLLSTNKAYYCFCSKAETNREIKAPSFEGYKYLCPCHSLDSWQIKKRLASGEKPVVRIRVPEGEQIMVKDIIRGEVSFPCNEFADFIIFKSDGWPTYNFAAAVDDHNMKITHVIRAEEHLSNTPKQLIIYEALGLTPPRFAHSSMVLAPDRSKLSKRHGATSVGDFKEQGYLPGAIVNYLGLLGWSRGSDETILNLDDMISDFKLEKLSRSPAIYDLDKMTWMNGVYLNRLEPVEIFEIIKEKAVIAGWPVNENPHYCIDVIKLLLSRAKTTLNILEDAIYFFNEPDHYDIQGIEKYFKRESSERFLKIAAELLASCPDFNAPVLEKHLRAEASQLGIKPADLIHPVRLSVSGKINTPGLFEVLELLGREKVLRRLQLALVFIKDNL
jgi:glutamyl-tRNA synthetase